MDDHQPHKPAIIGILNSQKIKANKACIGVLSTILKIYPNEFTSAEVHLKSQGKQLSLTPISVAKTLQLFRVRGIILPVDDEPYGLTKTVGRPAVKYKINIKGISKNLAFDHLILNPSPKGEGQKEFLEMP